MKTIRESFEDWYSEGGVHPNAIKCRTAGGEYLLAQAATSWNVWQAAHSSRDEEVKRIQEQVKLLREVLLEIAGTSANENSEPDRMADALGEIQGIVHRALEATKDAP